ncbi:hypothetical protein HTV45_19635 [Streptomyces sp. CHD11]|uniref:hypothetical protein n=1 Tax=Streptomyces sp. CHD11 TaxID=2741325 RepID=UPI001BFCBF2D|nr:hypothetical protein [Streptomyces sp. CHD11]MBT3153053.1 hypothetical protein [Streptomyces sp. CHD11]
MPEQDYPFGRPVPPKKTDSRPQETDDNGKVRLNPLWTPLEDIPSAFITEGREGAVWHYSVVEAEREVAGEKRKEPVVMLGSEEILTVLPEAQRDRLLTGMQEAARRRAKENPEERMTEPTEADLHQAINKLGHPTIAAGFTEGGETRLRDAMMSGELHAFPSKNLVVLNDKSGRYMSVKARGEVAPQDVATWGENVRKLFSSHLLGVTVQFQQIKTLRPPENRALAQSANALLPPSGPRAATEAPRADMNPSAHPGRSKAPAPGKQARRGR